MMILVPISMWLSDRDCSRFLSSIGLLISAFSRIGFMLEMYSE